MPRSLEILPLRHRAGDVLGLGGSSLESVRVGACDLQIRLAAEQLHCKRSPNLISEKGIFSQYQA